MTDDQATQQTEPDANPTAPTPAEPRFRSRRGRPRRDDAGEVEARLLETGARLFLAQGYAGTTMDQVAAAASASKSTLYSRYPTKPSLFAAVVQWSVSNDTTTVRATAGSGSTLDALVQVGLRLADATLTPRSIALMRATAAEAERLPEVALDGHRIGFGLCVDTIAHTLADHSSDFADAATARPLARRFVELALHPLYYHALAGHDLAALRHRARTDVPQIATYLLDTTADHSRDVP